MSAESDSQAAIGGAGSRLVGAFRRSKALTNEEFERLYAEHAKPLLSFLAMRTGDRALAEDLLADTFERVLRKGSRFERRRGSEKTWIYAIALNLLRDHLRRAGAERRANERSSAGAEPRVSSPIDAVEDRDAVRRVLSVLSEEEREAVTLRFGAGLSVPEIAELLGEPLTTAEGRVYRALGKLRAELERTETR